MLATGDKTRLLALATASIQYGLDHHRPLPVDPADYSEALQQHRASFVTLTIAGQLRGCIGSLVAFRPLVVDVVENAYAAAFRDPRFDALTAAEFGQLHYHISVLDTPEPMRFTDEADLLTQLQPGRDGLILEDRGRRGTFLPAVWQSLPKPADFLHHLKLKAGLPGDHWSDTLKVHRYRVEDIE